jgi:hypothetical protein
MNQSSPLSSAGRPRGALNISKRANAAAARRRYASLGLGVIGWILLAAAIAFLIAEQVVAYTTGTYRVISLGQTWFDVDVGSLNLVQAVIQRYIHPFLWDPIIAGALRWPAWSLLGGIGTFLVLAFPIRGAK